MTDRNVETVSEATKAEVFVPNVQKLTATNAQGETVFMEVKTILRSGSKFTIADLDAKIAKYQEALDRIKAMKAKAEELQ